MNGVRPGGVTAIRRERCETCAYVHVPTNPGEPGTCRFNPPTAQLVMVGTNQKGEPVMRPIGVYPPVGQHDYCHRWRQRVFGAFQSANDAKADQ